MLLRVSFTAPEKTETAVIVTAVVDQTIASQREFIRDQHDAERRRAAELKNRYEIELRNAQADVLAKRDELAMLGASLLGGPGGATETELSRRVNERVELLSKKDDADNADAALREMRKSGQTPPEVQRQVDQDGEVIHARQMLDDLGVLLADPDGLGGPNSAGFKSHVAQQELWQKKLDDLKAKKTLQYQDAFAAQIAQAKKSVDSKLEQCNTEIARLEAAMADIANKTLSLKSREDDLRVYREGVKEYDLRLQTIDSLLRNGEIGAIDWFARPHMPSTRTFPDLGSILTMSVLLGLSIGLMIAFLRELLKWGRGGSRIATTTP
jgi:uncharacterized protein involved in exopolysaccharide biosynthesis